MPANKATEKRWTAFPGGKVLGWSTVHGAIEASLHLEEVAVLERVKETLKRPDIAVGPGS